MSDSQTVRKIAILLLTQTLLVTSTCYGQDSERAAVREYVTRFLDATQNHTYDRAWLAGHSPGDHPDANPFGIATQYASIPEVLQLYPGVNVVLKSEIISIEKKRDYVDFVKPTKSMEYAYFVKIKRVLAAKTVADALEVLDAPETAFEYLILARDPSDGKYKYIDSYPSPSARFFGLEYFLASFDLISKRNPDVIGPNDKEKLARFKKLN